MGVSVEGICNSEYVASSDEMLLVQKSERIIGALAVLEKLKTLDTIVKDIEESIHEIIVMVKKLLPELVDGIRRVEAELLMHEFESGCLDSFYQCACVELEKHKRVLQNMEDEALNKQGSDILPSDKIFILREVLLDYRRTTPAYDHVLDGCKVFGDLKRKMDSHIVARKRFLDSLRKCFGVGSRGERFWVVLEKLHPYEVEIERIVMQQAKQLSGKNTVRGLDGIRDSVYAAYRRSHPVVDELLKERDFVLDEIDTFRCSRVKN